MKYRIAPVAAACALALGILCLAAAAPAAEGFDAGKEISVVSREDGSGTRGAFIELFKIENRTPDGGKKDLTTKDAIIANKTDVMMMNIANDPYAIGYISLGSLNASVKGLDIDGVKPTAANIKNGSYKISRPFNIATKGEPSGLTRDFITFILSRDGQAVVAKNYIPVKENASPYSGGRLSGKITVAGSSSVTPIMEKLKEAYVARNPDAVIEIQMSDSTAGMTGAINGACDIGMSSRELKDSEKAKLTDTAIAYDGIVVIVNNRNPLAGLGGEQVKAIFTGAETVWKRMLR
jgi:phosphate transport system substrate-binding protein